MATKTVGRTDGRDQYEEVCKAVSFLQTKTDLKPKIGIVCGSGLGGLAQTLQKSTIVDYSEIPGFRTSTVPGHEGKLVFGMLSGKPTVCMKGRLHVYEGYNISEITHPIRVMKLLGVEILVVTNAAGGLNQDYNRGDIMVLKDHINLVGMTGLNPLMGPNDERFGPRFPALTAPYDRELRRLALETARDLKMAEFTREGVYLCLSGPSYETPTESRFGRTIGGDTVGMSTAHETIVAKHCGMKVLVYSQGNDPVEKKMKEGKRRKKRLLYLHPNLSSGISLVTNMVILEVDSDDTPPTHEEVVETGLQRAKDMQLLVTKIVEKIVL